MRLVVIGGREIWLVGRDQRQALGIGEIDQPGFDAPLAVYAMALQFDIKTVAEKRCEALAARRRQRAMVGLERARDRSVRSAREHDQVLGVVGEPVELDVRRLMHGRFQERARIQPHQAAIAALARRKQHDCATGRSPWWRAHWGPGQRNRSQVRARRSAGCRIPPSCRRTPARRTCCRCRSAPAPVGDRPWRARRAWRS